MRALEWPTVGLTLLIYAGWLTLTFFHSQLPWPLVAAMGAILVAWQSSLQHEVLHGHPTPWRRVNRGIGMVPLSLWLPYDVYRIAHLTHHRDERLTDPLDDPESFYWADDDWARLGPTGRFLVHIQTCLLGRLIIGPAWSIARFWLVEFRLVAGGNRIRAKIWLMHLALVAVTLFWLVVVCQMSLVFYALAIVYPGTALLLIRSFAEHRAADGIGERTAIVENATLLGPLFLYNNLHAAHHEAPLLPWFEIPAWYRANRERIIASNGGLVYDGYADVARRFLLKPHDSPRHPLGHGAVPTAALDGVSRR